MAQVQYINFNTLFVYYVTVCEIGCTPCVNDLYQNDLSQWLQLESMTIEERQKWWQEKQKASSASVDAALTPEQFKGYVCPTCHH